MIYASKSTFSLNNLKILRPKVRKNLTNLLKKFCESPPCLGHSFPLSLLLKHIRFNLFNLNATFACYKHRKCLMINNIHKICFSSNLFLKRNFLIAKRDGSGWLSFRINIGEMMTTFCSTKCSTK